VREAPTRPPATQNQPRPRQGPPTNGSPAQRPRHNSARQSTNQPVNPLKAHLSLRQRTEAQGNVPSLTPAQGVEVVKGAEADYESGKNGPPPSPESPQEPGAPTQRQSASKRAPSQRHNLPTTAVATPSFLVSRQKAAAARRAPRKKDHPFSHTRKSQAVSTAGSPTPLKPPRSGHQRPTVLVLHKLQERVSSADPVL